MTRTAKALKIASAQEYYATLRETRSSYLPPWEELTEEGRQILIKKTAAQKTTLAKIQAAYDKKIAALEFSMNAEINSLAGEVYRSQKPEPVRETSAPQRNIAGQCLMERSLKKTTKLF
jgi:hypothetical protein